MVKEEAVPVTHDPRAGQDMEKQLGNWEGATSIKKLR